MWKLFILIAFTVFFLMHFSMKEHKHPRTALLVETNSGEVSWRAVFSDEPV